MAEGTRAQILLNMESFVHEAKTTISDSRYIFALTQLMWEVEKLLAIEKVNNEDTHSIGTGSFGVLSDLSGDEEDATKTIGHHRAEAARALGILIPEDYTVA